MDTLLHDIRYAARRLRRSPGFTLVAVLTLALGIGANSAIFSVVNAVLLQPLPFPAAERLDRIQTTHVRHGEVPTSGPDFLQMQEENRSYEALTAYTLSFPSLTGVGDPERLNGTLVSAGFFDALGVEPVLGRTFAPEENEPGQHRVAVLGHAFWRDRFGGDPRVLGRTLLLNGEPFSVVGVMPEGFDFPGERQLWTPLEYTSGIRDDANRMAHFLSVIGRRRAGTGTEAAAADIAGIAARIGQEFDKAEFGATVVSLQEDLVGSLRTPLLILLGAVGLVLLIACANVANLLLARATAREGELAVRTALGAERGRLVRQLLTESVLLGAVGGTLGLLLGVWGTEWLVRLQPQGIPRMEEVGLDWTVVGFTAGLSLLTGLIFGLVPAHQITRGDLVGSLKDGGRGSLASRGANRVRGTLVVLETALAVMLLVGAGLLIRSFAALRAVDPGFHTEHVLAFDLSLPEAGYQDEERVRGFYSQLAERLQGIPEVRAVGASSSLPMSGFAQRTPIQVQGRPGPQPGEETIVEVRRVFPDYFPTMGIPVLRGRGLADGDRQGAPPVALLTEAAARRLFPGEDPIGQRVQIGASQNGEPIGGEVVGVVGDVRDVALDEDSYPGIYLPHAQLPARQMTLVLRTGTEPMLLLPRVRRVIQDLDANLPVFNPRTLEQVVSEAVSQPRFYMLLLGTFAGVALVLSAIGIFGVVSYMVVQRTREIGIRMALGAAPGSVLRLVVGGSVGLALAGVGLGLAGALAGSRLLAGLLYGITPGDPLTFVAVALVLTAVALLASYVPARRATRVDPMVALRSE